MCACCLISLLIRNFSLLWCVGHSNGREPDDAELVSLSKKLVENAVLKAVQQYIEETQAKTKQTDGISMEPGNNEKTENNIKQ